MHVTMNTPHRDLGNGLVMRWSTAEDTERIANLHGLVHRDTAADPPNNTAMRVIRRLMHGDHPFMGSHDFAVIEDTSREGNPVVACTCLWKHTWTYEGIPFSVGRPEMVAVLRLEMVDKSTSLLQTHLGPVFGDEGVQTGLPAEREAPCECCCWQLHHLPCDMTSQLHLICLALKRKRSAEGEISAKWP